MIGAEIRLLGLPGDSYEVCSTMPAYIEFWTLAIWAGPSAPAKLIVANLEKTGGCADIPSGTKVRILDNDVSVEVGNGMHIASNQIEVLEGPWNSKRGYIVSFATN